MMTHVIERKLRLKSPYDGFSSRVTFYITRRRRRRHHIAAKRRDRVGPPPYINNLKLFELADEDEFLLNKLKWQKQPMVLGICMGFVLYCSSTALSESLTTNSHGFFFVFFVRGFEFNSSDVLEVVVFLRKGKSTARGGFFFVLSGGN